MNTSNDKAGNLSEAELTALGVQSFQGLGLTQQDAQDVCRILVLADLFGLGTHGLSRVESYGERLLLKGINPRPTNTLDRVAPALVKVNGDNGVGPLVGMRSLQAAMDLARECGVGIALARGSNHFGPVSPYSYIAAEAGFASIIGSNATTTIAPWGGSDARLGNSPMGFGVPNPGGAHFMLDMAMSVVARAKIRNAFKRGEAIPASWATDKQGRATTDPAQALDGFLLPIGGHKGYGLALLVDLFAGLLSGAGDLDDRNVPARQRDDRQRSAAARGAGGGQGSDGDLASKLPIEMPIELPESLEFPECRRIDNSRCSDRHVASTCSYRYIHVICA